MGLEAVASLVVATFELSEVRLLRQAIRAADLAGAADRCLPLAPEITNRRHLHPEPVIEPRQHLHPTPTIQPRLGGYSTYRPTCRVEPSPPLPPNVIFVEKAANPSPIQPPWKILPWENPAKPAQVIKVIVRRPDTQFKGTLLDCFI